MTSTTAMPKERFLVSRCYSEITPDSAEDGDFSDTGYVTDPRWMTLEDVLHELRDCTEISSNGKLTGYEWARTGYSVSDYQDGTEREETVHIKSASGVALAPRNLRRIFRLAGLIK